MHSINMWIHYVKLAIRGKNGNLYRQQMYSQLCEGHCPSVQNKDTGVHVVKDQLEK